MKVSDWCPTYLLIIVYRKDRDNSWWEYRTVLRQWTPRPPPMLKGRGVGGKMGEGWTCV